MLKMGQSIKFKLKIHNFYKIKLKMVVQFIYKIIILL